MSKKRHENQPARSDEPSKAEKTQPAKKRAKPKRPAGEVPWHPAVRVILSVLVILHVTAVFVAPWALSTKPALPPGFVGPLDANGQPQMIPNNHPAWQMPVVPQTLHKAFSHYLNLAYLNHGYEFFAPDPSGTHVIDYQVTQPDGTVVEGRFPDLEQQWPRLLYHRHMMLAEQTQRMGLESGQHYADHLARLHGGPCRLELSVHLLLSPADVLEGKEIDDPKTYQFIASVESQSENQAAETIAIPGGTQ